MRYTANQQQQLLSQAHKEKRIAHLCIDNQYSMFFEDTKDERNEWQAIGHEIAGFTKQLAINIPTVNTLFELDYMDQEMLELFQMPHEKIYYQPQALTIHRNMSDNEQTIRYSKITNDLVNTQAYNQNVFLKFDDNAFYNHGNNNKPNPLEQYLIQNKIDTLIISGMYAGYCIDATAESAIQKHYHVILVEDQIRFQNRDTLKNYPKNDCYSRDLNLDKAIIMHSDEIFETLGVPKQNFVLR